MNPSQPFETVINALRERWREQGILNERGATEEEIEAFEAHYGVVLPTDLRFYFLTVNGTVTGQFGLDDDDLIGFWHLDQICTFAEQDEGGGPDNPEALRTFIIADLSIWIHGFGVQLSADPDAPVPVVSDGGRGTNHIFPVAASFTEFIEGYLRGDERIIYADPPEEIREQLNEEREASQQKTLENLHNTLDKARGRRRKDSDNQ